MLPCRQVIATCTENLFSQKRCIRRYRGCRSSSRCRKRPIVCGSTPSSIGHSDTLNLNHRQKGRSPSSIRRSERRTSSGVKRIIRLEEGEVYQSHRRMKTLRPSQKPKTTERINRRRWHGPSPMASASRFCRDRPRSFGRPREVESAAGLTRRRRRTRCELCNLPSRWNQHRSGEQTAARLGSSGVSRFSVDQNLRSPNHQPARCVRGLRESSAKVRHCWLAAVC